LYYVNYEVIDWAAVMGNSVPAL